MAPGRPAAADNRENGRQGALTARRRPARAKPRPHQARAEAPPASQRQLATYRGAQRADAATPGRSYSAGDHFTDPARERHTALSSPGRAPVPLSVWFDTLLIVSLA